MFRSVFESRKINLVAAGCADLFFKKEDPYGGCRVYQGIVTCMEDWVEKCSHRRWLQERREEFGDEIQEIRNRMGSACGGPY